MPTPRVDPKRMTRIKGSMPGRVFIPVGEIVVHGESEMSDQELRAIMKAPLAPVRRVRNKEKQK